MEITTKSASETQKLGQKTAGDLVGKQKPLVIALEGNLGSGKTTFTQGFAKALGIGRVISPTFILMRTYEVGEKEGIKQLYHLDLYRLETNVWEEVKNLGLEEIWSDPESVVLVEWAEKIKDKLPKGTIWIHFKEEGENNRKITIDL